MYETYNNLKAIGENPRSGRSTSCSCRALLWYKKINHQNLHQSLDKVQFREALEAIQEYSSAELPVCRTLLATGFTPLHLQTFFHAHLQQRLPTRRIAISTGPYGDLAGTLTSIQASTAEMVAVALEWTDLDPRLGFRQLGGWGRRALADILTNVESRLHVIQEALTDVPRNIPMALSLPTLALPPVFHTPSWQFSEAEIRLRHALDKFALWASAIPSQRLVNPRGLQMAVPSPQVFDFKGELLTGLPYTPSHADRLGEVLARLLVPTPPKKGLITDLDETLWAGIAGEVGPQAVSWDLASHTQLHGLYQQLLHALAEQGVLVGVASKNDPEIVEEVFRRDDMLLPRRCIFPVEANWNAKSEAVSRILDTWNVHADSVVFVDDSPTEVAEVKAAHPEMECILFDAQNYAEVHNSLYRLRDTFAKQAITEEDGIRQESIRGAHLLRPQSRQPGHSFEHFLRDSEAKITFYLTAAAGNPRALELVNKTNQFNLNGIRYTESEWHNQLRLPNSFAVEANYRDKYGPLGVIAVLIGQTSEASVTVRTWVMSCRAFGRRIEHQCLRVLFDRFPVPEAFLEFSSTSRNECFQEFSEGFLGAKPGGPFRISRSLFLDRCPRLYHQVTLDHE